MKVHYLQHVSFEGLGYIETWLQENGHVITATCFYEADHLLPRVEEIDALIIMGGPMSVYDEHLYSWLHKEKIFIEDCIRAGKKVLGVCLGAQLMAVCLGAHVYTTLNKEIGWFPVMPTEECRKVPWLYELFRDEPPVFHWHGEKFEIPYDGSLNLLFSGANNNQAFYHNAGVIGLQFHLEVTEETVARMLEGSAAELINTPYIQTADTINHKTGHIRRCNEMMAAILQHWLA